MAVSPGCSLAAPPPSHGCRAWLCPYYCLAGLRSLSVSKPYSPGAGEQGSGRYIWWPRGHGPEHVSDNLKRLLGEPRMGPAEKWTSCLGGGTGDGKAIRWVATVLLVLPRCGQSLHKPLLLSVLGDQWHRPVGGRFPRPTQTYIRGACVSPAPGDAHARRAGAGWAAGRGEHETAAPASPALGHRASRRGRGALFVLGSASVRAPRA